METSGGKVAYLTFSPFDPETLEMKAMKMKRARPEYKVFVYDASCSCRECESSIIYGHGHFAYRELVALPPVSSVPPPPLHVLMRPHGMQ